MTRPDEWTGAASSRAEYSVRKELPNTASCGFLALLFLAVSFLSGCSPGQTSQPPPAESAWTAPENTSLAEEPSSSEQKSAICAGCHEDHYALWLYGGHRGIACTFCHGPAGDHVREDIVPRPKTTTLSDPRLCLACHGRSGNIEGGKIPRIGNFDAHLQYVSARHTVSIDIEKTGRKCSFCHDPHSLE